MADVFKEAVEDLVGGLLDASADSLPGWIRSTLKNSIVEEATVRLREKIQDGLGLEPEEALAVAKKSSATLVQDVKALLQKNGVDASHDYPALVALMLLALPSVLKEHTN